jgi:hypothetical protein
MGMESRRTYKENMERDINEQNRLKEKDYRDRKCFKIKIVHLC